MQLIPSLVILSATILPYLAGSGAVKVTYDSIYNDPSWPLSGTACSNGVNGLENKWPTLGDIPNYPFVGGIPGLTWNSTLCGTCWQLAYTNSTDGTEHVTTIIAVDAAGTFNIAEDAYAAWTYGTNGVAAGSVIATAIQVKYC